MRMERAGVPGNGRPVAHKLVTHGRSPDSIPLGDGKLCFMGEKSRSCEHEQDLGPLPSQWMWFIKDERHKRGVAEDRPHGYQSPADLEEGWVAHVAGTELEHYRWHCLRRGGATQLWASGARNQIFMLAGGRESPSVARHYTKPKHAWKFVERGEQPVPVCGENGYRLVYGDWSSKQWWPEWLRKELRELAAEAQTMATLWDGLDKPLEKGEGPGRQVHEGRSRRQWVHDCRMDKIVELGEELDMDLVRVHNAVCDKVQAKERSRVS